MKRALLLAPAVALAVTASPLLAAQAEFGPGEWTQYRAGPTRNAVIDTGGTLPAGGIAPSFKTDDQVRANPVIVGNILYVGNHESGSLNAFDIATGKQLWKAKAPNWIHSDMIDDGHTVYVGFGNRHFPSPTIRGTGKSGVMALDRWSGTVLWTFDTAGTGMPTPAVRNGVVYMATGGSRLYALDAKTGTRLWSIRLPGFVSMAAPAVAGDMLYVGTSRSLTAVDLGRRAIAWTFRDYGSLDDPPPAVGPDSKGEQTVVTTAMKNPKRLTPEEKAAYKTSDTAENQFIYAFTTDGLPKWKDLLGTGPWQPNNTSGAPAIADGKVFVGSPYTNAVYAYDLADGKRLWEFPAGAKVKGAPAIDDGRVYFGDVKGRLHVLDEATGKQLGVLQLGDKPLAPAGPVIVNGVLFVSSQDGKVYARPLDQLIGRAGNPETTVAPQMAERSQPPTRAK